MRVAVYGYGRAGKSLCATLSHIGVKVVAIGARGEEARAEAHKNHPYTQLFVAVDEAPHEVDLLFVAVSDGAVQKVARALSDVPALPPVVHLAGARGLDALRPLAHRTATALFHPLSSLDGRSPIPPGSVVAIDASDAPLGDRLSELATAAGLTPWRLAPGQSARYHAAATMAANLPVALFDVALDLLHDAGLDRDTGRIGLARLLRSVAENLEQQPPTAALTGAITRGDEDTVRAHLEAVAHRPDALALYRALSMRLLRVADLDEDTRNNLAAVLSAP